MMGCSAMSMTYYRRRHKADKGGSNKVTTLANLSATKEEKVETVKETAKPKTSKKK